MPVDIATFSAIDLPEAPRGRADSACRSLRVVARIQRPAPGRTRCSHHPRRWPGEPERSPDGYGEIDRAARRRTAWPVGSGGGGDHERTTGAQTEFTTEKWRLLAAVDRFVPRSEYPPASRRRSSAIPPVQSRAERLDEIRIRSSMAGLTSAMKGLGTILHRRKSVLFVSQGFPASLEEDHQRSETRLGLGLDSRVLRHRAAEQHRGLHGRSVRSGDGRRLQQSLPPEPSNDCREHERLRDRQHQRTRARGRADDG